MLDFFKTLVGRAVADPGIYETIEEVVAIADPAIRRATRYKKKLVAPLKVAQSYCGSLVDNVPGPVRLDRDSYFHDPRVKALFASPDQMEELLRQSPDVNALRSRGGGREARALLTMSKEEKTTFGHQKTGEIVMRDVKQRTVNFTDHRLVAPSTTPAGVQDGVIERGIEVLATVAMEHITNLRTEISELRQKRDYLQGAIKILRGRSKIQCCFANPDPDQQAELDKANVNLEKVEEKLQETLRELSYPEDSLRHLMNILENPSQLLIVEPHSLLLNWMNVLLNDSSLSEGNEIELAEFSLLGEYRRYAVWVDISLS